MFNKYCIIILFIITIVSSDCFSNTDIDKYLNDLESEDLSVKKTAIIMLGNMVSKEAVPALLNLLKNDENESIRRMTVVSLGKLKDDRVIAELIQAYQNNKGVAIKRDLIAALLNFNTEEVVNKLVSLLNDPSPMIRRHVLLGLAKMEAKLDESTIIKCLSDISSDVRIAGISLLSRMNSRAAVPVITGLLSSDRVEKVRISAAIALGSIGGRQAKKALIKELKGNNKVVSCYSAGALGRLKNKKGLAVVLKLSTAGKPGVRLAVVRALGNIKHKKAVKALKKLANDSDKDVRQLAREVLKKHDR